MTDPKPKRPEKKSEMLDVHLPLGLKQALVKACRKQGVTVSDTVRGLISEYVSLAEAGNTQPRLKGIAMKIAKNPHKTLRMTAAAALSVFVFAAQPSVADDALFANFDQDENGVLDTDELGHEIIAIMDQDHSNTIGPDEFKRHITTRGTTDIVFDTPDGQSTRELTYTIRDLTFTETPGESNLNVWSCSEFLYLDAPEADVEALLMDLTEKCERGKRSR